MAFPNDNKQQQWPTPIQQHFFIALDPSQGEGLRQNSGRDIPPDYLCSAPNITCWLERLLEDIPQPIYRTLITTKTMEFYHGMQRAQQAQSAELAAEQYKILLANPYFLYEIMNLFLLGYIPEIVFVIYSFIFAGLRQNQIFTPKINGPEIDVNQDFYKKFAVECKKIEFGKNKIHSGFYVELMNFEYYSVNVLGEAAGNLTTIETSLLKITLAKFYLKKIKFREIIDSVLQGKRPVNICYGIYPALKDAAVHGQEPNLLYLLHHDFGHLTINQLVMANKNVFPTVSNFYFIKQLYEYIQTNLSLAHPEMTAYLYYLIDFFPLDEGHGWLVYISQLFTLSRGVDEILLALAFVIEKELISPLIDCKFKTISKGKFTPANIQDIQSTLRSLGLDGKQKILAMKKWLIAINASQESFNKRIKIYYHRTEESSVTDYLERYFATGLMANDDFILVKLTKDSLTAMSQETITEFLSSDTRNHDLKAKNRLEMGFIKNSMLLIYLSPLGKAQYKQQNNRFLLGNDYYLGALYFLEGGFKGPLIQVNE